MALNVFISYISNETFNDDMELKQGYFKPLKEWTQSINLEIDDDPKTVQIGNTYIICIYIYIYIKDDSGGGGWGSNHIDETLQKISLLLSYH